MTGIIDHDTGRLIDVLPARSAVAVTDWLAAKPKRWLAGIRHVVNDPYQPYATAVARGLPKARLIDHSHVILLANAALDGVRRRTQQTTTGHRGRKHDPLYRIRRRLLASHDRLDPAEFARVLAWLDAGDPAGGVGAAYLANWPALGGGSSRPPRVGLAVSRRRWSSRPVMTRWWRWPRRPRRGRRRP